MGNKLEAYFNNADKLGGTKAKMRLTMISKITSIDAKNIPDSDDNIKKLEDAFAELSKEFK